MAEGEQRLRGQQLLTRLAKYGIVKVRQKGSHVLVLKPEMPGSSKGPTFPIPCKSLKAEVNPHIVRALLRRFGIDEGKFWREK